MVWMPGAREMVVMSPPRGLKKCIATVTTNGLSDVMGPSETQHREHSLCLSRSAWLVPATALAVAVIPLIT
jgi:hypothetical protein